jgi:hypothetical protein
MFDNSGLSGNLVIPEGIETIGNCAFNQCKITSVTLPSTIKRIEDGSFRNCSELTEVVIPASVTKIEWEGYTAGWNSLAFRNCPKLNLASQARLREHGYKDDF